MRELGFRTPAHTCKLSSMATVQQRVIFEFNVLLHVAVERTHPPIQPCVKMAGIGPGRELMLSLER